MKLFQSGCTIAAIFFTSMLVAQSPTSIYEMPRILVYGDASMDVEADVITCWLNIYDNTYTYDYSIPYDEKKTRQQHVALIDKLGCKDFMTTPTYAGLKSYVGTGPYELKFANKTQYEAMLQKVQSSSTEIITLSMDVASMDISKEKRKQFSEQMLDKALLDAKAKGERMAKGVGMLIGTPVYVEEVSAAPYYGYEGEPYSGYGNGMMVNVTARVQIQYELKK